MTRDEFQEVGWAGFLDFALAQPEFRAEFTRETGRRFGTDDGVMAFAVWATRTHWGWDEAPASFRKAAEDWEERNSAGRQPPGW